MILYNKHKFISIGEDFIYKCEKCQIKIWYSGGGYWLISSKNRHTGALELNSTLTCEEMMIKDIIE